MLLKYSYIDLILFFLFSKILLLSCGAKTNAQSPCGATTNARSHVELQPMRNDHGDQLVTSELSDLLK